MEIIILAGRSSVSPDDRNKVQFTLPFEMVMSNTDDLKEKVSALGMNVKTAKFEQRKLEIPR